MKTRSVVLILGVVAVLALGGYAAWQSSWVRSWLLPDSENAAEIDRAGSVALKNDAPQEVTAGSPQWRGPSRKGVAAAGSFRTDWDKTPPQELWRVPIGGGFGSCSVVAGKLYVQDKQGHQERVVCLDAETGQQVWEYRYDPPRLGRIGYDSGPRATPTVDGNWVFTVGESGRLLAIEATAAGPQVRWMHDLVTEFHAKLPEWGVAGSPLVYRDMVIVQPGGTDAAVVAFDKTTGQVKWQSGSHPPSYSSPVVAAVAGQDTIFAFMGDALLAVRPSDGTITDRFKWSTLHNANIATPLVVSDDTTNTYVFISAAYSSGSALLRAERSGDEVKLVKVYERRGRGYQNHHATSVYKDRHIFGIDGQNGLNGLKCIEFSTGKEVPDWGERSIGQASLILAGEHLILQSATGHLYLVEANPKEFHLIAKTPKILSGNNNWASPVLVDGRIYLRDEQHVVCLDVRRPPP
ncbi:MAG: PQQ-binding-like beta-propeller repeat protein [Gemmataceae bacterium]|nr:PQQ-binding-like beta-propeller repeat protein [Gemmata sp.]MDW8199447.1 PQQ-binding-like beta-propeller repeat protein [Gemmataceae bacterium]